MKKRIFAMFLAVAMIFAQVGWSEVIAYAETESTISYEYDQIGNHVSLLGEGRWLPTTIGCTIVDEESNMDFEEVRVVEYTIKEDPDGVVDLEQEDDSYVAYAVGFGTATLTATYKKADGSGETETMDFNFTVVDSDGYMAVESDRNMPTVNDVVIGDSIGFTLTFDYRQYDEAEESYVPVAFDETLDISVQNLDTTIFESAIKEELVLTEDNTKAVQTLTLNVQSDVEAGTTAPVTFAVTWNGEVIYTEDVSVYVVQSFELIEFSDEEYEMLENIQPGQTIEITPAWVKYEASDDGKTTTEFTDNLTWTIDDLGDSEDVAEISIDSATGKITIKKLKNISFYFGVAVEDGTGENSHERHINVSEYEYQIEAPIPLDNYMELDTDYEITIDETKLENVLNWVHVWSAYSCQDGEDVDLVEGTDYTLKNDGKTLVLHGSILNGKYEVEDYGVYLGLTIMVGEDEVYSQDANVYMIIPWTPGFYYDAKMLQYSWSYFNKVEKMVNSDTGLSCIVELKDITANNDCVKITSSDDLWKVDFVKSGTTTLTFSYTIDGEEVQTEKYQIVVQKEQYEVFLSNQNHARVTRFLPGQEKDVELKLLRIYNDENGHTYRELVENGISYSVYGYDDLEFIISNKSEKEDKFTLKAPTDVMNTGGTLGVDVCINDEFVMARELPLEVYDSYEEVTVQPVTLKPGEILTSDDLKYEVIRYNLENPEGVAVTPQDIYFTEFSDNNMITVDSDQIKANIFTWEGDTDSIKTTCYVEAMFATENEDQYRAAYAHLPITITGDAYDAASDVIADAENADTGTVNAVVESLFVTNTEENAQKVLDSGMTMDQVKALEDLYVEKNEFVTATTVDSTVSGTTVEGAALTAAKYAQTAEDIYGAKLSVNEKTTVSDNNALNSLLQKGSALVLDINLSVVDSSGQTVEGAEDVQPAAPMKITMPIPATWKDKTFKLYHYEDGSTTPSEVSYTIENGNMVFVVTSLSYYALQQSDPHVWSSWSVTAPTCTAVGYTSRTCSHCNAVEKKDEKAALGHTWGEWTEVSKATVFEAKTEQRICSICKMVETNSVGEKAKQILELPGNLKKLSIKTKKTATFKITMGEGDSLVSCKSSKNSVIKVKSQKADGTVKVTAGKKKGTAYLTFTLKSGKTRKYKVTVTNGTVKTTKVVLDTTKVTLKVKKTYTIKPTLVPFTSTQKVIYKSNKKSVATVSAKGKITAKKPGKATITVKSGSKTKKVVVTVKKK